MATSSPAMSGQADALPSLTSAEVKRAASELGADLVGIAAADVLNAFPPDPKWPQAPRALSPDVRSVIALAVRMPLGEFRALDATCERFTNQLVLRRMEKAAYRLMRWLEKRGYYGFQIAAEETSWDLKKASYGYLSTRHVGVEAGLGTLGLEVNILTPEFGPRIYLTSICTNAELEPDQRITEQLCIGESCGRCLLACPPDAVLHWGLDKRRCATYAQSLGIARLYRFLNEGSRMDEDSLTAHLTGATAYEIWQSMLHVVGAFGNCPRCIEVCPVGEDYLRFLSRTHRSIPEKTPEKIERLREMEAVRKSGQEAPGLSAWNIRWVGEDGYKGKKRLKELPVLGQHSNGQEPASMLAAARGLSLPELTAEHVKARARELGVDLVGIASGQVLNANPPHPEHPQTPARISPQDCASVIVLARALPTGTMRLSGQNRQKFYTAELVESELQEASLELVYFLEDHGYPSLALPANHTDYEAGRGMFGPLSLKHAAVEAGLGTLGLGLQLLTAEFGPRVMLAAVLTSAPLQADAPLDTSLCLGPECGRCLLVCPGEAIGAWQLDREACVPYSSPLGFNAFSDHVTDIIRTPSLEERTAKVMGRQTFELWQAMLHGVGAYTGCSRCLEVCPVGGDYDRYLREVQDEIPEITEAKLVRLEHIRTAERGGVKSESFERSRRWIEGPAQS